MLSSKHTGFISLLLFGSVALFAGCSPSSDSTASDNSTATTAPTVQSISPADGATRKSIDGTIAVTFSEAMDTSTITTNTANVTCSGTLQVSADNFTTCVKMSAAPAASNSDATFTLTPADNLSHLTSYLIKVTTGVKDNASNMLANNYVTTSGFQTDYSPAPFVLFASQYDRLSSEDQGAWTKTKEGGRVYVSAGYSGAIQDVAGKWDWSYEPDATEVVTRQSYGKQYTHNTALDDNDTIYINVKAPNNEFLNISSTDQLVIQMGNGADQNTNTNSHNIFTVTLNGGTQNSSDYSWSESCSVDQQVSATNAYGLDTYYISLDNLTCSSGGLAALKADLEEVVVKVIGGKNPNSDNTTTLNYTMPSVGYIGFAQGTATVGDNSTSPYVLFASQYEPASSSDPTLKALSKEGGYVKAGSGGNFIYGNWGTFTNNDLSQRQSFGIQWNHTAATPDGNHYVYYSFAAPDNGSVNVSNSSNLIIQMGNGVDITSNANTHKVFTVEVNGGAATNSWPAWTNSCYINQTLDNVSLFGLSDANAYGLGTYSIPLSSLTCYSNGGTVDSLKNSVTEVAIKLVGGNDATADNSTSNNYTLPMVGFIGFSE
jgi:hypothetical protein